MENETREQSSLRLYIPKQLHRDIKAQCAKIGKNNKDWFLAAIVAAYENDVVKGGGNGTNP